MKKLIVSTISEKIILLKAKNIKWKNSLFNLITT